MMNNSNPTLHSYEDTEFEFHSSLIVASIIQILVFLICIAGILGNGVVIRLLGFGMKRNPFTTYVLNLAVADIGVLLTSILGYIVAIIFYLNGAPARWGYYFFAYIWAFMYITDQLLLTTISIDRCVAVLFPLWHRCHRPLHLSGVVCVSVWVLSLLIIVLDFFLSLVNEFVLFQFIVNVALCTPTMVTSTIILFVKICTKSQRQKRGKLLSVISLALFFFLIFGFPVNYCYIFIYCYASEDIDLKSLTSGDYSELSSQEILTLSSKMNLNIIPLTVAFACTVLNCSINPLIYFLVGRKKRGQSRQSMKVALQRVFKDEGDCRGQEAPQMETQF